MQLLKLEVSNIYLETADLGGNNQILVLH